MLSLSKHGAGFFSSLLVSCPINNFTDYEPICYKERGGGGDGQTQHVVDN